jgi:hypothetical protein
MWSDAELDEQKRRYHEAIRDGAVWTVETWERMMNGLDEYMRTVERRTDWRAWGTRSIDECKMPNVKC